MRPVRITSRSYMAPALLGALSLSLLAGCGGGGGNGNGTMPTTSMGGNNSSPSANSISVSTPSGLIATLSEPSTVVGVNGSVTYTLSIRNPTATPIAIQAIPSPPAIPTAPAATLVVRDAASSKVYEPMPGIPALNVATLAPGQTLSTTIAVSAYATRGAYYATANFGETNPATTVGPLTVTAQ